MSRQLVSAAALAAAALITATGASSGRGAYEPPAGVLAFDSVPAGSVSQSHDIFVAEPRRRGSRRDLTPNAVENRLPAWSPDGKHIAFVSSRDGNPELYVMAPDGTGERRLTHDSLAEGRPAWSPDGKHIAF